MWSGSPAFSPPMTKQGRVPTTKRRKKGKALCKDTNSIYHEPSTFILWLSYPFSPLHFSIRPKKAASILLLFLITLVESVDDAHTKAEGFMAGGGGASFSMDDSSPRITVGIILPHIAFGTRRYTQAISTGLIPFEKSLGKYEFSSNGVIQKHFRIDPSPTVILNTLCKTFLKANVSAIIYLTREESYGRHTASSQYFLQLAGYLGIPVIAWNADNSGLEQASQSGMLLQIAPSIHHQVAAMLSILVRYNWHAFTVVTSYIAGHKDFVQAIRDNVLKFNDPADHSAPNFKFAIIDTIEVENPEEDLLRLSNSEARIMLLYSTSSEAENIMKAADNLELTGKNYVWIVTQSVIGTNDGRNRLFPVGMLGVHFDTSSDALISVISQSIRIFGYGVLHFLDDPRNNHVFLNPKISCDGSLPPKWVSGDNFYRFLKNVSIPYNKLENEEQKRTMDKPPLTFLNDGTRADIELQIVNLRDTPGSPDVRSWEEIGSWRSWEKEKLSINDIVWPGHQHVPPPGVPEKFHLKIVFLDEPPYISLANADPVTGQCSANRGTLCKVAPEGLTKGINASTIKHNCTSCKCCSGFCIDLLKKFSQDLGFTYDLERVEDGKWGTIEANGKWNGLVASLLNRKADMALSSFKINSERESVIDFTVPFLESGISIVVAKRTGIISPTAFLEPFDTASWMLVAFVAIQVAALTVFLFEWLSPGGYNMKVAPPRNHKFSLLRTYWLVWAVLFQAAVHVDCPKGFTARFMANIWAMFAVVFLAIYTANLAAFMITREEYHDLSGVEDKKLQNPYSEKPPLRFSISPFTNAEAVFVKHLPEMYRYMQPHMKPNVTEGIRAIKNGELDAFIYDATVLNYLVGQDEECNLLTVGTWYATTGYGVAFPRGSKYANQFNKMLMEYKENGELERLMRFWLTGACKPKKQNKRASEPLALEQFLSAYLLLFSGVVLAVLLLLLEHVYFRYLRKHLAKTDSGGCCALLSLSMGKSLSFRGAVFEAQDKLRRHRCQDPLCDTHIWKVKHELDMARVKIKQLEKELESHGVKPIKKFINRRTNILSSCWRRKTDIEVQDEGVPEFTNVYASYAISRLDSEQLGSRDVYGIRDMTHNHISSNDPSSGLRTLVSSQLPESSPAVTTSILKSELTLESRGGTSASVSTPCLTISSVGDLFQAETRQRSSVADIREIAEMETVL